MLLSVRNSTENPREVGDVFAWARAFNARQGFNTEVRDNPDFNLGRDFSLGTQQLARRRLLSADAEDAGNAFVVDGVVVSARSDVAACCLADNAVAAQQSLPASDYDLDMLNSAAEPAQVQSVVFVTQNAYQQVVYMPPPQEESASISPLFILFVVMLVFVCFCLCQKDCFSNGEQDTEANKEESL